MKNKVFPLFFACTLLSVSGMAASHAQTIDWGYWSTTGTGTYSNGDTIGITSLVNGSASVGTGDPLALPHYLYDVDPFAYANFPASHQFGFFHNAVSTGTLWSVTFDLTNFTMASDSVIGFSNLDTYKGGVASIRFLDENGAVLDLSAATFVGQYNYRYIDYALGTSSFDLGTGTWTSSGGIANAFFLTNLPTNARSIVYERGPATAYVWDATLFYAGNPLPVPEPTAVLLTGIAGMFGILRRKRSA